MSTEKKAASSLVTAHLRSALVILALSIHSLFEGMAVGMFHHNVVVAAFIAVVGIVFHNAMVIQAVSIDILFEGMAESIYENLWLFEGILPSDSVPLYFLFFY